MDDFDRLQVFLFILRPSLRKEVEKLEITSLEECPKQEGGSYRVPKAQVELVEEEEEEELTTRVRAKVALMKVCSTKVVEKNSSKDRNAED